MKSNLYDLIFSFYNPILMVVEIDSITDILLLIRINKVYNNYCYINLRETGEKKWGI